ncbi:MoaF-related domain-containing protein [Rubellimicrobium aerolatum]|uniref:MoaF-like domain-containing protein n=1 Tax=Rubellimicrobium aerolatum TaxID=490979 RepID=A0ABW0S813_9RHOB|nr:hypothetical protein [Rubellimicrobium aerolatum]MBP1804387.1 hypothetical protein [Rubellimicrobium aerolatum]
MTHSHDLVSKGEFVAAGHVYDVDFGGDLRFRLDFTSETEATYTSLLDPQVQETVSLSVTRLRPGLFLVTWTEKAGNTVVHIEDFENRVIYTNITAKDGTFIRKKGPITQVR